MTMTSDAKKALSKTIRDLRDFLLRHLSAATEAEYRLSIKRAHDAGLDEARDTRRRRLEEWMDEQVRADVQTGKKGARTREDFFHEAILQAAYTLLNRLVILRLMEAAPLELLLKLVHETSSSITAQSQPPRTSKHWSPKSVPVCSNPFERDWGANHLTIRFSNPHESSPIDRRAL